MADGLITVPRQQLSLPSARDVVAIAFRQRRILLVSVVAIGIGATVALLLPPKQYEARMQLLVTQNRIDPVVTAEATAPPGQIMLGVSEEELRSEVELLKSPTLLSQVVLDA